MADEVKKKKARQIYLDDESNEDLKRLADNWRCSVSQAVVRLIMDAVDKNPGAEGQRFARYQRLRQEAEIGNND